MKTFEKIVAIKNPKKGAFMRRLTCECIFNERGGNKINGKCMAQGKA